jgi:Zn finger protein HypA/HybF involved in hydrogenase expression
MGFGVALLVVALMPPLLGRTTRSGAAHAAQTPPKAANPHGDYKEDCSLCHSAKGWKPARISKKFDHERFLPLAGAHAAVACTQCHKSLDFAMAPTACVDCHADVHNGELGADCARCHGTRSFVDRNDHIRLHRLTRFPLGGAHATLDCEMCHRLDSPDALTYVNTASDCESCHLDEYTATTDPDHEAVGFPRDCALCHDEVVWSRARFDHASTAFPLTGAHVPLACERCHVGGVYDGLSSDCVSCHQDDYNGTDHAAEGFPTQCVQCHNTRRWDDANFNHAGTSFPLTGAHVPLACSECHASGVYAGLPSACISCHQSDYDGTNDPAHAAAGFSTTCTQCHNTSRWDGAQFNHTAFFPIYSGKHAGEWSTCAECHTNAASYADFSCLGCHPHSDQNETDGHHEGENGYAYNSAACYNCHPQGRAE